MASDVAGHRGDVVSLRLDPAEGREMKQTRPAVVAPNDIGNEHSSTTIVAPATGMRSGFHAIAERNLAPGIVEENGLFARL